MIFHSKISAFDHANLVLSTRPAYEGIHHFNISTGANQEAAGGMVCRTVQSNEAKPPPLVFWTLECRRTSTRMSPFPTARFRLLRRRSIAAIPSIPAVTGSGTTEMLPMGVKALGVPCQTGGQRGQNNVAE